MKDKENDKANKTRRRDLLNQIWTIAGGVASLIAIIVFITGKESIRGIVDKDQQEPETAQSLGTAIEPTPTPEYILQDDFSDPASGWTESIETYSERRYDGGEYIIRVGMNASKDKESDISGSQNTDIYGDCYHAWSITGLGHMSDIAIDVDARYLGGSEEYGAYGIIFNYQDKNNFYFYEFFPKSGLWELVGRDPGSYYDVMPFQGTPAFRVGKSENHLRLEVSKSLVLYVNGELVATHQVPYQTGDIGLWALACTDEVFEVAFDNVEITKLP